MTATVAVYVETGINATPVAVDTTAIPNSPPNIRFKTADDPDINTNNPIPIPASGTKRSFWKHIFLKAVSGAFLKIDEVKFFTNGPGFGTGITVFIGDETPVRNSGSTAGYDQATGVVGDDGDEMIAGVSNNHSGISAKDDAFVTFTPSTPKPVSISETTPQASAIGAIGQTSNYIVAQMDVDSTAGPGDLDNEIWTFQYDEI